MKALKVAMLQIKEQDDLWINKMKHLVFFFLQLFHLQEHLKTLHISVQFLHLISRNVTISQYIDIKLHNVTGHFIIYFYIYCTLPVYVMNQTISV